MKTALTWWSFERALGPEQLIAAAIQGGYDGDRTGAPRGVVAGGGCWADARLGSGPSDIGRTDSTGARTTTGSRPRFWDRLALAQEWGIPNLICFSGNRRGLDDAAGAENTAAGLRRVARAAEEAGITLVLELLNSKVDHPDYQCDRTEWGVKVCTWVNSPRVKLLYDIYHMQIMEGDLIRTIQTHHTWFGHYHVAGNPGRHEPDDSQEINYPAVYRAIRETGYDGFIGVEFVPSVEPVAALRAAAAAIRA